MIGKRKWWEMLDGMNSECGIGGFGVLIDCVSGELVDVVLVMFCCMIFLVC